MSIANTIDYIIEPVLKPIRIERKIVIFRKVINKIMRNPVRFQHVKLREGVVTRIETYENKQIVFVYTNVNHKFLKPYSKTVHN